MRKLFILLLVLCYNFSAYGQTYTITVESGKVSGCHGVDNGDIKGDTDVIYSSSNNVHSTTKTFLDVPNYSIFELSYVSSCVPLGSATLDCSLENVFTRPASLLIPIGQMSLGGCAGYVSITSIKPDVSIQNMKATAEECSGESLELDGFPAGFPDEAYHWQYSLDNQQTWIDVPAYIGLKKTNDIVSTNFSIQDILDDSHIDYFGKQLYFRLGYDQNRPFSAPVAITYSPCAPIIKNITYVGPKCSGDNIQNVTITFKRDLYAGEYLFPLSIVSATDNTLIAKQTIGSINTFEGTDPLNKTFSFNNFTGLENGKSYTVIYQAFQGTIPRGVITTPMEFTYNEPTPLKFTITQTDALCNGVDNGIINITGQGGTPPYFYILDNETKVEFVSPHNITGLSATDHEIKIIDANDCIEK